MRLHVIMPSYKRADLLRKALHSLYTSAEETFDCFVIDDCTPGTEISRVCSLYPVLYSRSDQNLGTARTVAIGLSQSLVKDLDAVRFLVASDHEFPYGWDKIIQNAVAMFPGLELAAFDHLPGPLWAQKKWHARGKPVWGKARACKLKSVEITCSLPSVIIGADAAKKLMEALSVNPIRKINSENVRDLFLGFWKRRIKSKGRGMFAITGAMIHHVGHGAHPRFDKNHFQYYKEQNRLKIVTARDPARP